MTACTRHGGHCAYPTNDHTRCGYCHRPWEVVTGRDGETAAGHLEAHLAADVKRAAARCAKAELDT